MIDVLIAGVVGAFAGSFVTIIILSLCFAARKGDEQ